MRRTDLLRLGVAIMVMSAMTRVCSAQFSGDNFRGFVAPSTTAIGINSPANSQGTWLGGDLGSMALLPNGTIVACFCDPDIGPIASSFPVNPTTHAPEIVRQGGYRPMGNSIAIMSASNGQMNVQHYFRGDAGRYTANTNWTTNSSYNGMAFFPILEPPPDAPNVTQTDPCTGQPYNAYDAANSKYNARIWVRKPIVIGTSLYVFGNFVTNPPNPQGGFLPNNNVENTLIMRITNPNDPPPSWNISYLTVGIFNSASKYGYPTWATNQPAPCFFGNEAFLLDNGNLNDGNPNDGYLYTYGTYYPGYTSPTGNLFSQFTVFPMRLRISDLESAQANSDVSANAQYFSATTQQWESGLYDPQNLSMSKVGDELSFATLDYSIRFNSSRGVWQAVFNYEAKMNSRADSNEPNASTDPQMYSAFIKTSYYAYGPWGDAVQAFAYPGLSQTSNGTTTNANLNYKCYAVREVPMFEPSDNDLSLVFTTLDASDPTTWSTNYYMYVPLEYDAPNPNPSPIPSQGGDDAMRTFAASASIKQKKVTPTRTGPSAGKKALKVRPAPFPGPMPDGIKRATPPK